MPKPGLSRTQKKTLSKIQSFRLKTKRYTKPILSSASSAKGLLLEAQIPTWNYKSTPPMHARAPTTEHRYIRVYTLKYKQQKALVTVEMVKLR